MTRNIFTRATLAGAVALALAASLAATPDVEARDVAYCRSCGKEYRAQSWTWTTYPITNTTYVGAISNTSTNANPSVHNLRFEGI